MFRRQRARRQLGNAAPLPRHAATRARPAPPAQGSIVGHSAAVLVAVTMAPSPIEMDAVITHIE